jgi:endonuclease/exonuclease/phosphatase family metal-dependent hydrolase
MPLSFFSLNIEADRHLAEIASYLAEVRPDVVHFQEIYRVHAETWAAQFGYTCSFVPHVDFTIAEHIFKPLGEWGIATLTKQKPVRVWHHYYSEEPHTIPHEFMRMMKHPRAILMVQVEQSETPYIFGNTHFTWALPDQADKVQAADFARLQSFLHTLPSFVLSGDFNAPRGSLVWNELTHEYITWVPESVESTLDPTFFRKPGLKLVVDHLFSTSDYVCDDVQVLTGLSDHCGLAATISRQAQNAV